MVFGKRIWMILLKQLLIKVCIFLLVMVVVLNVSAPYSSTYFTLELNRHIFVCNDYTLELQMFLSCINAPLALPILALTSASVPPRLSIILPRYVEVSTSSISFPSILTGSMLTAFTVRSFVLHLCIFNPTRKEMAASSLVFSCICWWLWDNSAGSSINSRSSSCVFSVHWIPFLLSFMHIFKIQSLTRRKKNEIQQATLYNSSLHFEMLR